MKIHGSITDQAEVLEVLQAGGHIQAEARAGHAHGLVHLFDVDGAAVSAWQTAILPALSRCVQGGDGLWRMWR